MDPYLIVGGGPAGAAAARRLASSGQPVLVLTNEPTAPYDRTTLSTTQLFEGEPPPLWTEEDRARIELQTAAVTELRPRQRTLRTDAGQELTYRRLLLATGARARHLAVPGFAGPGVHTLRSVADARALAAELLPDRRLVVVGAGVIGLEVAASARLRGLQVRVLEVAERVLARSAPAPVAQWLADQHRAHGVEIFTGVSVQSLERTDDGRPAAVRLLDGRSVPADVVLVGVGIEPNDELAAMAGIEVSDGIVVDPSGRTSMEDVFAAGDVARMNGVRLESYQAAGRQGEVAAAGMLGEAAAFTDVPWTWSDQYDLVMQAAGLPGPDAFQIDLSTPASAMVLSYQDDRLVGACGAAPGPVAARPVRAAAAVIAGGGTLPIDAVVDTRGDLSALTTLLRAAARGT